jgi:hypothetical protein
MTTPGGARVYGGRRHSGPAGDGDDDAEGRATVVRVATLWAEAMAVWNEKTNLNQSELCGARGERSSVLLRILKMLVTQLHSLINRWIYHHVYLSINRRMYQTYIHRLPLPSPVYVPRNISALYSSVPRNLKNPRNISYFSIVKHWLCTNACEIYEVP